MQLYQELVFGFSASGVLVSKKCQQIQFFGEVFFQSELYKINIYLGISFFYSWI